jgi:hypothetical protein
VTEFRQKLKHHTAPFHIEVEHLTASQIREVVEESVSDYQKPYCPSFRDALYDDHCGDTRDAYRSLKVKSDRAWDMLSSAFANRCLTEDFLRDTSETGSKLVKEKLVEWAELIEWPSGGIETHDRWTATAQDAHGCREQTLRFMEDQLWPFTKAVR